MTSPDKNENISVLPSFVQLPVGVRLDCRGAEEEKTSLFWFNFLFLASNPRGRFRPEKPQVENEMSLYFLLRR